MYLHGRHEPIAHLNIKPENILVLYRDPSKPRDLHIKLSDFGYIKPSINKKNGNTQENTTYMPPELRKPETKAAQREEERYGVKVDIWSLGVVILGIAFTLPPTRSSMGRGNRWCEKIADTVQALQIPGGPSADGLLDSVRGLLDILRGMLITNAEARCSATECWSEATRLLERHVAIPASARETLLAPSQPYLVCVPANQSSVKGPILTPFPV